MANKIKSVHNILSCSKKFTAIIVKFSWKDIVICNIRINAIASETKAENIISTSIKLSSKFVEFIQKTLNQIVTG